MCVIMAFPYDGYSVHGRAGTEAQDHRPINCRRPLAPPPLATATPLRIVS